MCGNLFVNSFSHPLRTERSLLQCGKEQRIIRVQIPVTINIRKTCFIFIYINRRFEDSWDEGIEVVKHRKRTCYTLFKPKPVIIWRCSWKLVRWEKGYHTYGAHKHNPLLGPARTHTNTSGWRTPTLLFLFWNRITWNSFST